MTLLNNAETVTGAEPVGDAEQAGSTGKRFWTRFRSNRLAMAAGAALILIALVGIFAPWLTTQDPSLAVTVRDRLSPPGADYWLGADHVGRDIFARLLFGARYALIAGLVAVSVALAVGIPLGLTIGYFRGWVDRIVMRMVEAVVAVPAVVFAIALIAVLGSGLIKAMLAIGLVYSMIITRLTRAEVFAAREELYVDGARASGAGDARIMFKHVLPNIAPALIIQTTLLFAQAVLAEAALSFLGLGANAKQASWGQMLNAAKESINESLWVPIPPGAAIFVTVVAFNVLGDGLRDAFGREARGGRIGVGNVEALGPELLGEHEPGRSELADLVGTRPPDRDAVLSVRDLTVRFPRPGTDVDVPVVDGVHLDIGKGETLALVGESGSGKSISALSLLGLVPDPGRAAASSIMLDGDELIGKSFDQLRRIRGRDIGLISQEPSAALNPAHTVGRQIAEPLMLHFGIRKSEARQQALELMAQVGIPDPESRIDSYPHQFSGGMAQRVVIAMALACTPKLLIADEPTTALDVTVQGQVLDVIGSLSQELHVSVLLITHDLGVVSELADRVAVMYAGQIVETGTLSDVFHNPQHPYTEGLIAAIPRNEKRFGVLPTIEGVVPPPWDLPSGCHFADRCPYVVDACRRQPVSLVESATSLSRCIRAGEVELRGVGADRQNAEEEATP